MKSDPNCIFCKIAAGSIPALKILEDDRVIAFLDIGPLADGHLLVIPKEHYVQLDQMPPGLVADLCGHLPKLSAAVVKAVSADGYNILQNNGDCAGQEVQHVHFHIIPRVPGDGLGYRWLAGKYAEGRDKQIHQQILAALD